MLQLDATEQDRKLFLEETGELLQRLDEDLVRLEKEASSNELLQEIFRAAHTIKGSAGVIGHRRMADLTHAMETALDMLRKGSLPVSTSLIDALLQSLDVLRVLNEEVTTLEESGVEIDAPIRALEALTAAPPATAAPLAQRAAAEYSEPVKVLHVALATGAWSAVRALQVTLEVGSVARIIASNPTQEQIEQEAVAGFLDVVLPEYADESTIAEVLAGIPDLDGFEFRRSSDTSSADPAGTAGAGESAGRAAAPDSCEPMGAPTGDAPGGPVVPAAPQASRNGKSAKTVRIDVERLDNLLNLVGELVIDRTRLNRLGAALEARYGDEETISNLIAASLHIDRITDQLQEEIMKSRMLPIETVFNRLPRLVRDLAVKMGKRIDFETFGQETELDRSVIEEIGDPLIHLLRNCVDHGIEEPARRRAAGKPETGRITISASHADNHIVISVEDDGTGIDPHQIREVAVRKGLITREAADKLTDRDAHQLIFAAGLSTAKSISDVSGRGVGMDIVKTNIEKLSGSIEVESMPGQGTRFTIRLPLTLAIIQALLVTVSGNIYAIPIAAVNETLRIATSDVHYVNKREAIQLRGEVLPLVRLREVFSEGRASDERDRCLVVAVRMGSRQVGFVVDTLVGEQEIVIKPLGSLIGDIEGISGAAILGDGRVALIIDIASLLKRIVNELHQEEPSVESSLVLA